MMVTKKEQACRERQTSSFKGVILKGGEIANYSTSKSQLTFVLSTSAKATISKSETERS